MRKTVDKKACKEFADPELKFNLDSGILYLENITYIIRTAIKNIAGRRTLILYLYDRKKLLEMDWRPVITVFQISTDHQSLVREENGEQKWHSAVLSRLISDGYYTVKHNAFYSLKDQKRVFSFCGKHGFSGEDALEHYQQKILNARKERRVKKRELAIKRVMDTVPKLTRREQNWLDDTLIPKYIFYTYQPRKKPADAFCTACGQTVELASAKHNQAGVCPRCGKKIVFKARGRQSKVWDRNTAQIFSRTSENGLVLRVIKGEQCISDEGVQIDFRESARYFLEPSREGGEVTAYYDSYDRGTLTTWKAGRRPTFMYQYSFEGDDSGALYTDNLSKMLKGTLWQYSQLETYMAHAKKCNVLTYLLAYRRYPTLEYLIKLGLFHLAEDVVYAWDYGKLCSMDLRERTPEKVLRIPKQYIPLLQKLDADNYSLGVIQCVLNAGRRGDLEEIIAWSKEHEITDLSCHRAAMKYTTPYRWMKYISEQAQKRKKEISSYRRPDFDARIQRTATEYKDYLRMCETCEVDLSSEFDLFPANLQKRHDELMKLSEKKKRDDIDSNIKAQYAFLKKRFGFQKDGFKIVPPRRAADIKKEGSALHHCVGRYAADMAERKTVILFVRQQEAPSKPFFTMEVKNGNVIQLRGLQNCDPTEEVSKFVEKWKKQVLYAPVRLLEPEELAPVAEAA